MPPQDVPESRGYLLVLMTAYFSIWLVFFVGSVCLCLMERSIRAPLLVSPTTPWRTVRHPGGELALGRQKMCGEGI